jgi:hypothetical protein
VNSTHPDYEANVVAWQRARDVFAGEDAVKAAGEKYLPRLDSQDDTDYLAYKNRASFFNASARTADGFVGLIFRRDPTFKLPNAGGGVTAALSEFVEDADMLGTPLTAFSKRLVTEIINVGRAGTLIDWGGSTAGPMGTDGQRAYAVRYDAEDIINWHTERVNGRNVLTLVVLQETCQKPVTQSDPFIPEEIQQLRVLKLVPPQSTTDKAKADWSYIVEIWQLLPKTQGSGNGLTTFSFWNGFFGNGPKSSPGNKEWKLVDTVTPLRLGKPLPLIPFVFHGPRHSLPDVDKVPLDDIIAINLDHYRLNADYKHGMHFTALPTAWVSGFDKTSNLRIGSSTAWVAETPGATAGFLEFHGQGLSTFERAMDRDEQLMAVLGTRMLESKKRVGETAAAIELRQSGENSILNTVSLSVSASLTQVLRWVYWWNSTEVFPDDIGPDLVLATLNTDFSITGMSALEITALVAAWQAGAISHATMLDLFRAGEVIAPGRTNEEEIKLLAAQQPPPATAAIKPPVAASKSEVPQPLT